MASHYFPVETKSGEGLVQSKGGEADNSKFFQFTKLILLQLPSAVAAAAPPPPALAVWDKTAPLESVCNLVDGAGGGKSSPGINWT